MLHRRHSHPPRKKTASSGIAAVALSVLVGSALHAAPSNSTVFGPNVHVFDSTTPADEIRATTDAIFTKMEANQFGTERHALLFKPGNYDLTFNVGFYTHVAGLGLSPDDVRINGGVNVPAKWMPNANATCNFWRTIENLAINPSSTKGVTRIAVSQAAPLRRLHVIGELHLFDFDSNWNAGWASGGFLADSAVDGKVVSASQQQWLSRNSKWGGWNNAVWNMVFVGCENAPAGEFPEPAYTVIAETPVIREKPFLRVDKTGAYQLFVPALRKNAKGTSWSGAQPLGKDLSLDKFLIARPETATAALLNAALADGRHLLFTPGIYRLDETLRITKPGTILFGLGLPSLIPTTGKAAISIADVDGVTLAGLTLEAGPANSPVILDVGPPECAASHAADPTFLYDLTVRTGGPAPGRNDTGIRINSRDVVADQIWIWRADHGSGASWTGNPTKNGLVVNGDNAIIYGLFNEHHNQYQTLWNGNGGRLYFYQSEIPYDVPDQASWMNGKTKGYASYKVADSVTRHEAWGLGVYCYFRDAAVELDSAIEAPVADGVRLHNLTTIWLNGKPGSAINHIVNRTGGAVTANQPAAAFRQTLREFGKASAK